MRATPFTSLAVVCATVNGFLSAVGDEGVLVQLVL